MSALFDRVAHHFLLWLANSAVPEVLCEPVTQGADSDLDAGSLWHRGLKLAEETACICSSMLVKNEKCSNRFNRSTCMCDIWLNDVSNSVLSYFFSFLILHMRQVVCVLYDIRFILGCEYLTISSLEIHIWPINSDSHMFRSHLHIEKKTSICLKSVATW